MATNDKKRGLEKAQGKVWSSIIWACIYASFVVQEVTNELESKNCQKYMSNKHVYVKD